MRILTRDETREIIYKAAAAGLRKDDSMAIENLTNEERLWLNAIRTAAVAIGKTSDSVCDEISSSLGISRLQAQTAVFVALRLAVTYSARLCWGANFAECENLDELIVGAVREAKQNFEEKQSDASQR